MYLSEIKKLLPTLTKVGFELENGTKVPEHYHVTELGVVTKNFIDCGGTVRTEKSANFQLWNANDFDHRLAPTKLLSIINLAEKVLQMEDVEIEIEYQGTTIEKYDLSFNGSHFILMAKHTACLASDKCGIPKEQLITNSQKATCTPSGGCC